MTFEEWWAARPRPEIYGELSDINCQSASIETPGKSFAREAWLQKDAECKCCAKLINSKMVSEA